MKPPLERNPTKKHRSWWWDSHISPKNSKWLAENLEGKDLDAVLKATLILPEKEARIIIVQIFQGLVYLNKRAQKIIYYDLKPGNVLFDEVGVAKVRLWPQQDSEG